MKITYHFTDYKSDNYEQALALRYRAFYEQLAMPIESVIDDKEAEAFYAVAVNADNDAVVGCVRISIEDCKAQIAAMVVEDECQYQGIGSKLIGMAMSRARELGINYCFLHARITAIEFYRKHGFQEIGEVFPSKLTGVPHVRMESVI